MTTSSEELAVMARRRIAELELDLHRWRRVLILTTSQQPTAGLVGGRRVARAAPPPAPIEHIISVVADRYGATPEQLLAHDRSQPATSARQVAMRLARELTGKSYATIGRAFRRDHATVIHACQVTATFALSDLRDELAATLNPTAPAAAAARQYGAG